MLQAPDYLQGSSKVPEQSNIILETIVFHKKCLSGSELIFLNE